MTEYGRVSALLIFAEKYYSKKKFKHAMRVANYAAEAAYDSHYVKPEEAFVVGLAHDLIEDTDCPQDELNVILGDAAFSSVCILTKGDDTPYEDYIHEVLDSCDKVAIHVKRADMKDHMAQIDTLTDKLRDKYLPILHYFL